MKLIKENLNRILNILEYPELIGTFSKNIEREFVKELLFIKKQIRLIPNTILDIGASVGKWTKAARFVFPKSIIYSFEPIPESFKIIQDLKKYDDNLYPFNIALSSENKRSKFYLNEFSCSSSLLKMTKIHKEAFPFTKKINIVDVECKRLDSINNIKWVKPVLVKIDVQGTEKEVLLGAGDTIKNFDMVKLEVSFEKFYENQVMYDELFSFMKAKDFNRFLQVNPSFATNRLAWCDLIFFR